MDRNVEIEKIQRKRKDFFQQKEKELKRLEDKILKSKHMDKDSFEEAIAKKNAIISKLKKKYLNFDVNECGFVEIEREHKGKAESRKAIRKSVCEVWRRKTGKSMRI